MAKLIKKLIAAESTTMKAFRADSPNICNGSGNGCLHNMRNRCDYSGKAINGMEKKLFRHDDILFFALMFAADKPARFRRHAQVKQLSDSGGINPHCHAARLRAST